MVNLAISLKTELNDVSTSSIILTPSNTHMNEKETEVNAQLKELCEKKNIYPNDNTKKIKPHDLKKGKLDLNRKGSKLLKSHSQV